MKSKYSIILAALLCALFVTAVTYAETKKFTVKDLPVAVVTSFQKTYPKAKITGVDVERRDSIFYYEIESTDGTAKRDLLYTDTGEVYEMEEEFAPESLPADIIAALDKQFKLYTVKKAEKLTHGNFVEFEIELKCAKSKYLVTLDGNGKILETKEMEHKNHKKEKKD